jgi:hypothetical protein
MPLEDMCVQILDSSTRVIDVALTDEDGRYEAIARAGTYIVAFFDCRDEPIYGVVFYNDASTPDTANLVTVSPPPSKRSNVNAALARLLAGDVDCDEERTSIDAALILQGVAGLLFELACQYNADIDGDGFFSSVDAALILQFVAGLLSQL